MLSALSRAVLAGALLARSAQAGDHFILTQVRQLSYTRVDPLRTPATVGPHVHNVVGGSKFAADVTTQDALQQSKCSSIMVQDDKSSYWTPLVYYNRGDGTYSPVVSSTRIYYFLKPGNGTTPVKPFPKGFRMLGGGYSDSRPQTYPPRGELSYDQKQALDPRVNAIMWGCSAGAVQGQGDGGSLPGQRPYLPNDAPNGCGVVNAGMFFPSCGDGRLDSDDHFSHMAYPLDDSNGYNCPPSHPIKYPTIFIEHFYFPSADQPYRGANKDNWILSNGDPTGLNMHGDFINGWNQDTLEQTLNQCNTPNAPEADLQSCAPLARTIDVDAANTCLSEGNIADEDVGLTNGPITGFPGCNPYWGWESRTKPTCATSSNVGLVAPSGRYTVDEFKINLPIANGTSKTVTGPSVGNSTDYYSSYYGSSSSYASAATSSYAASTTDTSSYSASTTASVTETASSSYASPTGESKSEDPTSVSESSANSSTASASVPGSTSSASYDYGYVSVPSETPASTVSIQSVSGSASQATSTSDPVQTAPGSAQTTSASYSDLAGSNGGNPPATSASSSSTVSPANAAPTPQNPGSHVSSSISSSTSPANAAPTPQNANTLNPGNNNSGKPKTCRRKSNKLRSRSHARRHRQRKNLIH